MTAKLRRVMRNAPLIGGLCCKEAPNTLHWDHQTGGVHCLECGDPWAPLTLNLEECERLTTLRALAETNYVLTEAAKLLGTSRHGVSRRMTKFGIEKPK
jgi:transcriptional regulator with GAF, ATPase, and Fis domain